MLLTTASVCVLFEGIAAPRDDMTRDRSRVAHNIVIEDESVESVESVFKNTDEGAILYRQEGEAEFCPSGGHTAEPLSIMTNLVPICGYGWVCRALEASSRFRVRLVRLESATRRPPASASGGLASEMTLESCIKADKFVLHN